MLIFWSCSQGVRAYQQVKDTCLIRPDSSVVRASDICLEGPGFNPWSGRLFCLTESVSDSEIDEKDLLENFGEEYIIPSTYPFPLNNPKACSKVFDDLDSSSKEFEYFL
jgi:hypothetical protein